MTAYMQNKRCVICRKWLGAYPHENVCPDKRACHNRVRRSMTGEGFSSRPILKTSYRKTGEKKP